MKDKVVWITGAKGGLGTSVTQRFLDSGATVVGSSRSIEPADFPHPHFVAHAVDILNAKEMRRTAEEITSRLGRIDALVHLVGGYAGGTSVAETDDDAWEQMRDLNLTSAFHALRAVIPIMREQQHGRIVAIGSLTATQPHSGVGAYVTFKSALVSLVQTVAIENKDTGITANLILPGTMDTPGNREAMPKSNFAKWVQPADVASLILWLIADQAAQVNGVAFPVSER